MDVTGHRVYYALWPDAGARAALHAGAAPLAAAAGGRPVPAEQLHLTLAFVGAVAPSVLGALARLGTAIAWPVARLRFSRAEWWATPQVLVMVADETPALLIEAQAALCARLAAHGLATDAGPFRAHVTIARDVRTAPAPCPLAVEWTATQVALVESQSVLGASRYRPLALWEAHGLDFK